MLCEVMLRLYIRLTAVFEGYSKKPSFLALPEKFVNNKFTPYIPNYWYCSSEEVDKLLTAVKVVVGTRSLTIT